MYKAPKELQKIRKGREEDEEEPAEELAAEELASFGQDRHEMRGVPDSGPADPAARGSGI
jgi:hypothetical protein